MMGEWLHKSERSEINHLYLIIIAVIVFTFGGISKL